MPPVSWAPSATPALLLPTLLVSKRQGKKHLEPTAEPRSTVVPRRTLRHHAVDGLQAGWSAWPASDRPRPTGPLFWLLLLAGFKEAELLLNPGFSSQGTPSLHGSPSGFSTSHYLHTMSPRHFQMPRVQEQTLSLPGNCIPGSVTAIRSHCSQVLSQKPESSLQFLLSNISLLLSLPAYRQLSPGPPPWPPNWAPAMRTRLETHT